MDREYNVGVYVPMFNNLRVYCWQMFVYAFFFISYYSRAEGGYYGVSSDQERCA